MERAADPTDGRVQRLRLTARGLAAVQTVRATVRATEADWADRIGAEHLEQLRALLRDLAGAIREDGREPW